MISIEALPLIVMKLDHLGTVQEVSPATSALLGFPESYFVGRNFFEIFGLLTEDVREGEGGSIFFERTFRSQKGEEKYLSWKILSLTEKEKIALAWDITSVKQENKTMLAAKKEAEAASQTKSDFIAHTSHELRTPLNAVIGYSEMLLDEIEDADPAEVKHDLEKINTAAKHLLSLINSVLDLSKIEAGKMELFNEEFDLASLLMEVGTTVETLAKKKHNQLELSYPEKLGSMFCDRTKLREILFNLLSNACKFTEAGKILLKAKIEGSSVILEVQDTGCGMTEAEMKKLFIPYSQVGTQKKKPGMGTGLGLMLCKKLSEMMGGQITVASEFDKGTTFTVTLPLVFRAHTKEKVRASDIVLVIDDDPAVHEIIRHILKKEQLKIVSAMNGEEGLRLAKECQPLAIILDLIMPVMDGWEVLAKLKEDPMLKDIPVVVSTVDDSVSPQARLSVKVDEYLIKPINSGLLVSVLNRYRPLVTEKYSLLIVDDDEETRNIVVRIAEKEGWNALEAANGDVALKSLEYNKPSLILLDLMMPVMNGFEFVQHFRKQEDFKKIPIVVLTSKDLTAEERKYLGGFAHQVLEKGRHGIDELKEIIREIGQRNEQNFDR
jgi:signal transduction histidine kinase/CheY-like chemotaxis protein